MGAAASDERHVTLDTSKVPLLAVEIDLVVDVRVIVGRREKQSEIEFNFYKAN